MKKNRKILVLSALVLAVAAFLCSCGAPNTVTTNTEFRLALVTSLYPEANGAEMDERAMSALMLTDDGSDPVIETVTGSAWKAISKQGVYYKYYTPSEVEGTSKNSYSEVFTEAATQQLSLAVSGGAERIVIIGDTFADAYLGVKDNNNLEKVNVIVITVPGSRLNDLASVNGKTTVVVLDNQQLGYHFGYYAALNGGKKIGYVGLDGAASESFIKGLTEGAKAGGEAEVVSQCLTSVPTEDKLFDVVEDKKILKEDNMITAEIDKTAKDADIVIGDELTMSFVAKYCKEQNKKYASIFKDDDAEFYITVNSEVLTSKLTDIIRNAGYSKIIHLLDTDGIFKYSGGEMTEAPYTKIADAVYETAETAADTSAESSAETAEDTSAETAAETETDAETTAETNN